MTQTEPYTRDELERLLTAQFWTNANDYGAISDCLCKAAPRIARQLLAEMDARAATQADYEAVLTDHRRLVRALDVAMHGEEGAAPQASLCDLIEPARRMRDTLVATQAELAAARAEVERLKTALRYIAGLGGMTEMEMDVPLDDGESTVKAWVDIPKGYMDGLRRASRMAGEALFPSASQPDTAGGGR